MQGGSPGAPAVPPRTRHLVHLFLAVFVVCGIGTFELFPFSGFRLFSELRGEERLSWQLRAVEVDGDERPILLADLPLAYRKTTSLIPQWDDLPPSERDGICDAWTQPMRDDGIVVTEVRIYRLVASVRPDGPRPERTLAYTCGTRAA